MKRIPVIDMVIILITGHSGLRLRKNKSKGIEGFLFRMELEFIRNPEMSLTDVYMSSFPFKPLHGGF